MNYIQFSYKADYYGFCYNDILLSYSITEVLSLVTQLATKDPRYRHVYQEKERRCVGLLNRKKSLVSIQDVCGPSSFRSWVQRVLVVCENEARDKGPASACMDFLIPSWIGVLSCVERVDWLSRDSWHHCEPKERYLDRSDVYSRIFVGCAADWYFIRK